MVGGGRVQRLVHVSLEATFQELVGEYAAALKYVCTAEWLVKFRWVVKRFVPKPGEGPSDE